MNFRQLLVGGLLALPALGATGQAKAEVMLPGAGFSVSCANGGNYVLESGPVAAPGQIVTARFHLSRRHAVPVRLIPMGNGYRYAGHGVWLDGIRDHALLYLSKYQPIPCLVSRI
jgi:hypothetical protein